MGYIANQCNQLYNPESTVGRGEDMVLVVPIPCLRQGLRRRCGSSPLGRTGPD